MKRLLLGFTTLLLVSISAFSQKLDGQYYAPSGEYTLENLWTYSTNLANYTKIGNECRGMVARDGILYFCSRDGKSTGSASFDSGPCSILLYSGVDGSLLRSIALPDNVFKDANGGYVYAPNNDIQMDDAGNLLVSNLCTNIGTSTFQIWSIKLNSEKTAITSTRKLVDVNLGDPVVLYKRIDAFNVYGNVDTNGYLLAAIADDGSVDKPIGDQVLRWDIKAGEVATAFVEIKIKEFYPVLGKGNGTAPRVSPVNESFFYLDGFNGYANLYDMDGNMVDGFKNAPTDAKAVTYGHNGVDEFTIIDKSGTPRNFVVYAFENTVPAANPTSWAIAELGQSQSFSTMKKIYSFPANGLGKLSNPVRTAVPCIDVKDNTATIYVYGATNGYAAYKLTLRAPTGISSNEASAITITNQNGNIVLSEEVASIEVYTLTGQKLAQKANTSSVSATFASGIYIVKVMDKAGKAKTQKIVVE